MCLSQIKGNNIKSWNNGIMLNITIFNKTVINITHTCINFIKTKTVDVSFPDSFCEIHTFFSWYVFSIFLLYIEKQISPNSGMKTRRFLAASFQLPMTFDMWLSLYTNVCFHRCLDLFQMTCIWWSGGCYLVTSWTFTKKYASDVKLVLKAEVLFLVFLWESGLVLMRFSVLGH